MSTQEIQTIKQRFGIIGQNAQLNRGIEVAVQVALTDLSVLITGESGVGKEFFPQIIHAYSARKHGPYFAVNCGAIPEGTIDSELFGHEKGAFTDAKAERKGYFEIANGGTLFLDEVGELPLQTQVRLLRVLETGEFIRMGSSQVQKTNVRVVAATNLDMPRAIQEGRFREDLYYRLNTVEIKVPALRERKEDIPLLFRKFALDFSDRYRMPAIRLNEEATELLKNYYWNGNVRQLKNVAEQISIIETNHDITADTLRRYLPANEMQTSLQLVRPEAGSDTYMNERELLYKVLFDMKREMSEMRQQLNGLLQGKSPIASATPTIQQSAQTLTPRHKERDYQVEEVYTEEVGSMEEVERETIRRALEKTGGNRRDAARLLSVSERTLYRKIKEYQL
ncbi:MAG: sigma-54-dependent Fis family transcriptional regulator [Paludibacteraceae bacterium]|nr:sigma-54-dependent Fis family transcriptional regulator [Paludibacteraceae bacterium]